MTGISHALIVFDNENGELALTTRIGYEYDSNIFGSADEVSDTIIVATPKFQFRRDSGLIQLDASAGIDTGWYTDNSFFDYEDFKSDIVLSYPNEVEGRLYLVLGYGYNQNTEVDSFLGGIQNYDDISAFLSARYRLTDRFGLRFLPKYRSREYEKVEDMDNFLFGQLSDWDQTSYRFDLTYNYSPKLELLVGYRYNDIDSPGRANVSGTSNLLLVGLEGEITPKIDGIIEVGAQSRTFDADLSDLTAAYFNVELSYALTDRTSLGLSIGQDFDIASTGVAVSPFVIGVSAAHSWNSKFATNVELGWLSYNFNGIDVDRTDTLLRGTVTGEYTLTDRSAVDARLIWQSRDSDNEFLNYSRLRAQLGMTFTF